MKKLLLLCIAAFSVSVFLPLKDIFSSAPIYTDDYAMHFSQCLSFKRFFLAEGRCWGYDPYFLAGFPNGALVNADNKAWELLFLVLSPLLSEGFAFKLYLYLLLLLYPFLIYGAARNLHLSPTIGFCAALLGMLFFHLSLALDFVVWGMVSYVFVCFLTLYLFSLFYRLFESFTLQRYLLVTLLSSLLLLMHILSPLLLLPSLVILYLSYYKTLTPRQHLSLALMLIIVLALNSYWLIPVIQFFQDKTTRPHHYRFTLQIDNVLEPLTVYLTQKTTTLHRKVPSLNNTFMDAVLLLFGCAGFYRWVKEGKRKLFIPLTGGALFLFSIAYYGSHTEFFAQLQPQRFTLPLNLLLLIPASVGLTTILPTFFKGKSIPALLFTGALTFILLVHPVLKPLKTVLGYNLYRLSCEFPAPLNELLSWLETHTTREGRIVIEDSECDTEHQFYGGHFPALFPEYVKREYLLGPRPLYPIKHSYASFTAGVLFEKDIEEYTFVELYDAFERYNVKWVVCWSEKSKNVFSRYPGFTPKVGEVDKFYIFEVLRTPSFFLKGSGRLTSDYNRLELTQLVPEDGEIIISYHWMPHLKTEPERTIEKALIGDDPVGFIRIKNPPPSLRITL